MSAAMAGRRGVLRGLGAGVAAAGIAGAAGASLAAGGADAALINACHEIECTARHLDAIRAEFNPDDSEDWGAADEERWMLLLRTENRLRRLVARTAKFQAATIEGLRARARAIEALQPELIGINGEDDEIGDSALNAVAILLRDLGVGS